MTVHMQVAGKQYHELEAKCKEQLQLRTIITAPATTVTCIQCNDGDQQSCPDPVQPSAALSSYMETETDGAENTTAAVFSVPVPPSSPTLSPDVISGSLDSSKIASSPLLTSIEAS